MLKKSKFILVGITLVTLFACTTMPNKQQPKKSAQARFLKEDITQSELNNLKDYKRYYYVCKNAITSERASLVTYFPLSRESRKKENFGIYFQLSVIFQKFPGNHCIFYILAVTAVENSRNRAVEWKSIRLIQIPDHKICRSPFFQSATSKRKRLMACHKMLPYFCCCISC